LTLEELGYNVELEAYRLKNNLSSWDVGRVISEHKERYRVRTSENEYEAEVIGNLRFSAKDRADFPAVGDWVAISEYDENRVLIHAVYPRKTAIERRAAGMKGEKQIIASNIDIGLIIQSVDRDLNLNRLERYLTLCHSSGVQPVIVLTKIDLFPDQEIHILLESVRERVADVPVFAISNETHKGYEELQRHITKGNTYCLLGSSGVGKSTLVNNLTGRSKLKTDQISQSTGKGKHITSHRELFVLDSGGILIDNPGMREVGITDDTTGLYTTFEFINNLSGNCRYKDCSHVHEEGCAVTRAVAKGELDQNAYENYLKMAREREHMESTLAQRRKKDKEFGKMIKHLKQLLKKEPEE
jgi:ribosome biogenesis GTPase